MADEREIYTVKQALGTMDEFGMCLAQVDVDAIAALIRQQEADAAAMRRVLEMAKECASYANHNHTCFEIGQAADTALATTAGASMLAELEQLRRENAELKATHPKFQKGHDWAREFYKDEEVAK